MVDVNRLYLKTIRLETKIIILFDLPAFIIKYSNNKVIKVFMINVVNNCLQNCSNFARVPMDSWLF